MPFFIVPLILLSASIIEEPLFTDCSTADRYGVDSPFQTNLRKLLNTLPSLTSPTGFNNTSEGEPPDKVYGQALCRGDVSSAACEDCVDNASWEILKECNTKEAIIWYQLCQVHYSSQNFFGSDVYNVKYPSWNDQERLESGDTVWFNEEVDRLLRGLIARAAYEPTKRMFATGAAKVSKGITIYGLVQCTRDLSGDDCKKCLQTVAEELLDDRRQGGILLSRNCNVRFEVNRFYNVTGDNFEPVDILVEINEIRKNEQGKWKADGICVHLETGPKWKNGVIVYVVCGATVLLIFLSGFCVVRHCRETRKRSATMRQEDDLASLRELPCVDLATIRVATNDFSDDNKIGRGGFGIIYKGVMPDGKEIAVKRLSRKSWQGMEEFKSEVSLIAQLQHRNLVRLLGFGMEEEEKLLIYEFMPNKSLDTFTFDSERRGTLTWKMYYSIIGGIARGLLYLHEDSRLKIIHRDLKPSNILLDHDMVAKISDFGMARIFGEDQNTPNTKRVTGTYGYMAPEYAMEGLFSTKSDVYSFGVILLEIISGKKNRSFYLNNEKSQTLLTYAWRLWNEGRQLELVDPALKETSPESEVERCINIGLLCVQQDPDDRPQMSSVVAMLRSDQLVLPRPRKPSSSFSRIISPDQSSSESSTSHITSSAVSPR